MSWPAYLDLAANGELERRSAVAGAALADCALCPRACHADRRGGETGVCGIAADAVVTAAHPHFGEESCLTGRHGSGTIFFAGCNLGCVFCQNWGISHEREGRTAGTDELAAMMLALQEEGCHNINLVTPSHVVAQVLAALVIAVGQGLHLPIVYNSGGYDAVETLCLLDGVVDIYMPDFKIWSPEQAARLLLAPDYPVSVRAAIEEMWRQVGDLALDTQGIARRGLLVRHLVMPAGVAGSEEILGWLAALSPATVVNVMAQYRPHGAVRDGRGDFDDIARAPSAGEVAAALAAARRAGLTRAGAL